MFRRTELPGSAHRGEALGREIREIETGEHCAPTTGHDLREGGMHRFGDAARAEDDSSFLNQDLIEIKCGVLAHASHGGMHGRFGQADGRVPGMQ